MQKRLVSSLFWFCLALLSPQAQGYPEMIRHAYGHCGTCHVSPSGSGMLTEYGRGLAKEVLATWSGENEALPMHGLVTLPKSLALAGGIRTIQTYADTPSYRQGRYFLMQADLDAGWITEKYSVVVNIGRDIGSPDTKADDKWTSATHYVFVPLSESISVRAGRFQKNYGLNIPDHIAQIKRGLGWNNQKETYNAELNIITEDYSVALTAIGGRPDDKNESSEKGYAVSLARIIPKPALRIGGSYFSGQNADGTNREILGPNISWGITERAYLLGEYDLVRVATLGAPVIDGFATYTRAGFEIIRGLDINLIHESRKTDRRAPKLAFVGYGPGFTWNPRPHLNLSGQWQKQQRPVANKDLIDSAWLVMQYWI